MAPWACTGAAASSANAREQDGMLRKNLLHKFIPDSLILMTSTISIASDDKAHAIPSEHTTRMPGVDLLRAIAILSVMAYHLSSHGIALPALVEHGWALTCFLF
ncbi:MAG: hypothetical protein ABW202_23835 [Duganella sp.]